MKDTNMELVKLASKLPPEKVSLMTNDETNFGTEAHYAVKWEDVAGNYHLGWVPCALWNQIFREK